MKNKEFYEVTKFDYIDFLDTIKPEFKDIQVKKINSQVISTEVYSKLTNKLLCSRTSNKKEKEKYYIFTTPEAEESLQPMPKVKIELKTKEEIQAFMNFLKEQNKND